MDGARLGMKLKRTMLGSYVRMLERVDPQVAHHLLSAQRELFLAGKVFFEEEIKHADQAMAKIDERLRQKEQAATNSASAPEGAEAPKAPDSEFYSS